MNRSILKKLLVSLLVTGYLVLAVGSVWHVSHVHSPAHDPGHNHNAHTCIWCMAAATLLILAPVIGLLLLGRMPAGLVAAASTLPGQSYIGLPWSSRAPPVS